MLHVLASALLLLVFFALQRGDLHSSCLVLPYCCVCVFPATIRLHAPQALAPSPAPYGKANEAGSAPQGSRSVYGSPCFSLMESAKPFTRGLITVYRKYRYIPTRMQCEHSEAAEQLVQQTRIQAHRITGGTRICCRPRPRTSGRFSGENFFVNHKSP